MSFKREQQNSQPSTPMKMHSTFDSHLNPSELTFAGMSPLLEKSHSTSTAAQVRMLKSENDLLRAQISSYSAREKELRSELTRKTKDLEDATQKLEISKVTMRDKERVERELHEAKSELGRIQQTTHAVRADLRAKADEQEDRLRRIRELEAGIRTCAEVQGRLTEDIEALYKKVMPGFRPTLDSELPPNSVCQDLEVNKGNSIWLIPLVRFEKALRTLEMVIEAKLESMYLVKSKLQEQNRQLEIDVERIRGRQDILDRSRTEHDANFKSELERLQFSIEKERKDYEERVSFLQSVIQDADQKVSDLSSTIKQQQASIEHSDCVIKDLSKLIDRLKNEMAAESQAKADILSELQTESRRCEALKIELEQLKLLQLASGAHIKTIAGISTQQVDALKAHAVLQSEVERLRKENNILRADFENISRSYEREQALGRLHARLTDASHRPFPTDQSHHHTSSSSFGINKKVEDETDLAVQILRKNIQAARRSKMASEATSINGSTF
eukprot:TRINITY_DN10057_c0_g1_i1.p1 TRINITY_DN10057_c0_g1~~TRINITY_DN10057_c0_g1_i1.p1  ORF type:complete len:503 (+),score=114.75 TRINITY_DN10057_c0_g1_i1:57-1565(+)